MAGKIEQLIDSVETFVFVILLTRAMIALRVLRLTS
ncbi:Uncharacterised protein [Yersinia frederiksenii]|jgi:hypothetical protein|nr:Uncharacterised protein [Yersinia frederiksenii]CNG12048.1 Uncharacterised protein [Yersinia frederiksenii]CNL41939.1 Uncharacterised protein [Yersinia frederiksenii]CQH45917.1 Uncharacterised protein [Yersinia frederiksenii]CQJ03311.1 Uncharacterised protein [Yersinia frederiksenii]